MTVVPEEEKHVNLIIFILNKDSEIFLWFVKMQGIVFVNMERNVTKFILQIYVRKMKCAVKSIVIKDIQFPVSISKSMENVNLVNIAHITTRIKLKKI